MCFVSQNITWQVTACIFWNSINSMTPFVEICSFERSFKQGKNLLKNSCLQRTLHKQDFLHFNLSSHPAVSQDSGRHNFLPLIDWWSCFQVEGYTWQTEIQNSDWLGWMFQNPDALYSLSPCEKHLLESDPEDWNSLTAAPFLASQFGNHWQDKLQFSILRFF